MNKRKAAQQGHSTNVDDNEVNQFNRVIHLVVDGIGISLFSWVLSIIFDLVGWSTQGYWVALLSFLWYYGSFESAFARTPGKFLLGTRVVTTGYERPKTKAIVIRTLCRLIPFDPISYLFKPTGFHDYLSGTRVVRD